MRTSELGDAERLGVPDFASQLDPEALRRLRADVRMLSVLRPARSLLALAFDWTVIAIAWVVAIHGDHPLLWIACIVAIGTRQHALLLLMHDAAHMRLHPDRRLNDWLSDLFCAYPLLVTTARYRASHLQHHRFTHTDDDPDWRLKRGQVDWQFPKSGPALAWLLSRQLAGLSIGDMLAKVLRFGSATDTGGRSLGTAPSRQAAPQRAPRMRRVLFYLAVATGLTITGAWGWFVLLWLVPIFTVLAFVMRVRSIAEHFGLAHTHELNSSRSIVLGPLERLVFGPHHSGLHLDHHLFPSVPFYNLPALHRRLRQCAPYSRLAHVNGGVFVSRSRVGPAVLNDLLAPARPDDRPSVQRR